MNDFTVWLLNELNRRDWTPATLAKRGGFNPGNLSHVLNGERSPSNSMLLGIALALDLPPENVFRRAGVLPSVPESNERVEAISHLFRQLSEDRQALALATLHAWREMDDGQSG